MCIEMPRPIIIGPNMQVGLLYIGMYPTTAHEFMILSIGIPSRPNPCHASCERRLPKRQADLQITTGLNKKSHSPHMFGGE
jgi:hypothetical protein